MEGMDVTQASIGSSIALQKAAESPSERPLIDQVNRLEQEAYQLHETINLLADRLGMVLRPEEPVPTVPSPSTIREEAWRISERVGQVAGQIAHAQIRLHGLNGRLEV